MANALQERYGELLLDHIRADRYPSVNHMNLPRLPGTRGVDDRNANDPPRPGTP